MLNIKRTTIVLTFALIMAACGGVGQTSGTATPAEAPTLDQAAMDAAVASTVSAELTRIAIENPSATPPPPTNTEAVPTGSPTASPPPLATISSTALEDHALFLADVTIPDGTVIVGGNPFTKTWRLQNIGSNTWTSEYSFVFVNGDRMEGFPVNLTVEVLPGGILEISIPMVAPDTAGTYEGFWMLADADNVLFGIGENANEAVLVSIVVIPPTPTFTPSPTLAPTATPTVTPTP